MSVGRAFILPTPGPVLLENILGVDLGVVIGLGLIFGKFCGERFDVPMLEQYLNVLEYDESKLPSFGSVVGIIMISFFLCWRLDYVLAL